MDLSHKPYVLIILDGWGYSESTRFNAIHSASKPAWNYLWEKYPHLLINASGTEVGLPDSQMGNSEVGHMNIGSGRIVEQDFTRIMRSIGDGSFYKNKKLVSAFNQISRKNKCLHIMGLLSPGGIHSHQDHIFALANLAKQCKIERIYLHAFLDGRDTPPKSAHEYIRNAQIELQKSDNTIFASITGRYYAMDRNRNWDRTKSVFELIMEGQPKYTAQDPSAALDLAYQRGETDEFVQPTAIVPNGKKAVSVSEGDLMVFANFRADRARQLSQAFTDINFDHFQRLRKISVESFIGLTQYKEDFKFLSAFPPPHLENVLGQYLSNQGLTQLRIAEKEKYDHVTLFLNGGEETVFNNEDRILIPSPNVKTYDLKPEMSAIEVTDNLINAINNKKYDVIVCNYANSDMVGHTGNFDATVQAIECIDTCLKRIYDTLMPAGGEMLITSDHGNAEQMRSSLLEKDTTQAHTAHTTNFVPLIYVGRDAVATSSTGALCDIAPTLLHIMDIKQPKQMTGRYLFEF